MVVLIQKPTLKKWQLPAISLSSAIFDHVHAWRVVRSC